LSVAAGGEKARSSPIVTTADSTDNPEDRVSRGDRVFQTLQREERGAFRGDQTVCVAVERAAPPRWTQCTKRGEPGVEKQIVGTVDSSRHHQVGPAIVKLVAGKLDGVERRGAGCVDGVSAQTQFQDSRGEFRGKAEMESVSRVGWFDAEPKGLRDSRHGTRWIPEIAEHETCAPARPRIIVARTAKGFMRSPERPLEKRIKRCGVHVEFAGVEHGFEAADVSTFDGCNPVDMLSPHSAEQRMWVDSPMATWRIVKQIAAVKYVLP
jgi:hypothetical protein